MEPDDIVDALRDWLDDDDWHYEYDAERKVLKMGVTLKCKLRSVRLFIPVREDKSYIVNTVSPLNGDKDNLTELMKYLTMANYGLANGDFELDVRDGEIRYKTYVNCDGLKSLPEQIIKDSIYVGCSMMERYGDGIAALAMGFSDAETEIAKAESPTGADSDD